jgi:hypothetical protein
VAEGTCAECGTELTPGRRRYCTTRCRKAAERKRYRAKLVPMDCAHCGTTFTGHRWHDKSRARYCSPDCQAEAKRLRYGHPCEHGWIGRRSCPECAETRTLRSVVLAAQRTAARERAEEMEHLAADPCAYCGTPGPHGIDHIDPTSTGGADDPSNWTACCHRCNGQKGTLPLLPFLLWKQLKPYAEQMDRVQQFRAA